MEWSKIKNIIILILAIVNVFLLVMTVNQTWRARQYREETLSGAVEVLRRQGVEVDPAMLPGESVLRGLTAERDREGELHLAEALLGVVVRTDDGSRVTYTGNNGEAWFRGNGSFSLTFRDRVHTAGGGEEASHGADLLTKAGFPCAVVESVPADGDVLVTVRQTWEGAPLFTCRATLRYRGGSLVEVTGQRLTGAPEERAGSGKGLDIATILIRFLGAMREGGHVFSHIERLTPGYRASTSPGGVTDLEPVWEAVTDGGAFFIDGATGALIQ